MPPRKRLALLRLLPCCLLGCADPRLPSTDAGASEGETGGMDEQGPGSIQWIYESDVRPQVLSAIPQGVLVAGVREDWSDPELPDSEGEVFALDLEGERRWTSVWDPQQLVPARMHALARDEAGVWVAFSDFHGVCTDWCPGSVLARLDLTGVELWRRELSTQTDSFEIRPLDGDAIVVGAGSGSAWALVQRIDASGELVWEWSRSPDEGELYTTGVELFDGALWVTGQEQVELWGPREPWIGRLDPETGELLGIVDSPLIDAAWSAEALADELAVVSDERLWVLDQNGDWVWTRGYPPVPWWPGRCMFDARDDQLSAVTCNELVELLDGDGSPRWIWDPSEQDAQQGQGGLDWEDVALGELLYLAGSGSAGSSDTFGKVYALTVE